MENWILAGVIIVMNLAGFLTMGIDKKRARNNHYRISEKTLWNIAFLGGATGATAGMKHYRHKTKHTQFKYGMPLLAIIEIGIFTYLFKLLA
ncbi:MULTISPECIES: DUF1294 domain-containing protein [Mesobacillus]|uniref:DUF1294 domain-containing protein n=1 Tax=Mesobacillus TaxID=2675231 RepID=UPI00177E0E7E|nr:MULTISPECIES: DUF1294 domain-containing protein [Mesobacillus]MCM3572143.1 DUF1294 domain-containing protein [Mesobacillus subterraneus]UYZ21008.1 DUF1294 domain-containing protein [Mesobacillus jeotgali]